MGFEDLLVFFLGTSVNSIYIIRSALKEVLRLSVGRRKKYREIVRKQTNLERISLHYIKNNISKHQLLCKVLLLLNYIYKSFILMFLVISLLFILRVKVFEIFIGITVIKVILMDIPTIIFFLVKTRRDKKNGGVMWKILLDS